MASSEDKRPEDAERVETMRHSASHVMAEAVKSLFPGTRFGIGPAIENGFYYDFELTRPLTNEDLPVIEARMTEIVKANTPFIRSDVTKDEARRLFADQPYKLELIGEIPDLTVGVYRQGDFVDLCRGPHVKSTGEIKSFKLTSIAGAYWRGSEKRPMMQRIYAVAFESKQALDEYLKRQAELEARDHRRLNNQLKLYVSPDEVGGGLIIYGPKAGRIRTIIEDFWRQEHYANGYDILYTPHIGRSTLWEISGHLDFYKDSMYSPMDIDGQDYYLKPMNCPFHILFYKSQVRSYRELPLRWAELGTVYRYEKSGELHGLLRVRGFTQDDAHIFCTPEQMESEVDEVLRFALYMLRTLGFRDFAVYLSTRPEKAVGDEKRWQDATAALRKVIEAEGLPYKVDEGGGAFYGPKIDIKFRDAFGREWQLTTIQFDFNLPDRFNMVYVGPDGQEHRPYMVHRALLGAWERFFGLLIEHYGGAFPVWLAPQQVAIIPVADRHLEYSGKIDAELKEAGIRVKVDASGERMNQKIRAAQLDKVPYMIIIGDKEIESATVSVRLRTGEQLPAQPIADFKKTVKRLVEDRSTALA